MIEKFEYPPNYEEIKTRFDIEGKPVVFTYGDILYNPHEGGIPPHLIIHEKTHTKQQGNNPKEWWDRYLIDDKFRFDQEVEAYRNQYKFFKETTKDRNAVAKFLFKIASDLSGEIYGNLCTHTEAQQLIRN